MADPGDGEARPGSLRGSDIVLVVCDGRQNCVAVVVIGDTLSVVSNNHLVEGVGAQLRALPRGQETECIAHLARVTLNTHMDGLGMSSPHATVAATSIKITSTAFLAKALLREGRKHTDTALPDFALSDH